MSTRSPSPTPPGPPGAISVFFVAKAAFFGAVSWAWTLYLVTRGPATGWLFFAAGAGICFTLVAVLLGVRCASERAAALRHTELLREVAQLSWDLAAMQESTPAQTAKMFTIPGGSLPGGPERTRR